METISTKKPMTRRAALVAAVSLAGASALAVKEGPGILDFLERSVLGSRVLPLEDYGRIPAAREVLKDGLAQFVEGANLKAILRFKETVRQDPRSVLARLYLVQALLNVGEQNAVDDMKESLHASMIGSGDALISTFARAVLSRADAKYSEASEMFSSLSRRYPGDLVFLLSYARVVEETGEMMRAQQLYERAAKRSSVAGVLGMGRCLAATGELPRAIALVSDSLRSGAFGRDPEVHGMAHSILGFALRDQGHLDAARSSFEDALNYRREAGDRRGQVASLCNLAAIYRKSGRLKESIGIVREALEIARAMGDDSYESHALYTLAVSYDLGGSDEQALSCARTSLEIELRREDHAEIPVRLNFLANVDRRRGRYGEARVLLDRALEHTASSGDRLIEANRVWVGARIDKEQGRYEQALEKLNSLISGGEGFDEPSIGEVKAAIAEIHDQRGEYGIADRIGRESFGLARERRVSRESVFIRHWSSQHLSNLGVFRRARSSLEEARSIATELHLREMLVGLDVLDATIDAHEGSLGRASKQFQSCLEQAEHSGFAHLAVRSRVELAKALVRLEELDEAGERLERTKAEAARSEMLPMQSTCRMASAELELFRGNCEGALADAKMAADLARSFGGRPLLRTAYALMGEAHARLGDEGGAARCFDVAGHIHKQIVAGVPSQFSSAYTRHPDTIDSLRRIEAFKRV